jgi:hypothetical protein
MTEEAGGAVRPLVTGRTGALGELVIPVPDGPVICGAQAVDATFAGVVPHTGWTVRAASVRGPDHAQCGEDSQDVFGLRWSARRGSLLVALADGLGSLPESGAVARRAVEAGLDALDTGEAAPDTNVYDAVAASRHDVEKYVAQRRLAGATTLLLAELVVGARAPSLHCALVGDCAVWAIDGLGWRTWISRAGGSRATATLSRGYKRERLRGELPHPGVLVIASDGFATALGDGTSVLATELRTRWATPPSPVEFLNQVSFEDEYFVDDRTVVAVWPTRMEGP